MLSKLTLTIDKKAIQQAKKYAQKKETSLSKMIEIYFKSLSKNLFEDNQQIPKITKELSGYAKMNTTKNDKQLLAEALNKKYL